MNEGTTCATCRFWHKHPSTLLIGQDFGECRAVPPVVLAVATRPGEFQERTQYPKTPSHFPACGVFEDKDWAAKVAADLEAGRVTAEERK